MAKELNKIIDVATGAGWTVERGRRGGHLKFRSPAGALVVTSWSPSDVRAMRNLTARLRREGLEGLPRKGGT